MSTRAILGQSLLWFRLGLLAGLALGARPLAGADTAAGDFYVAPTGDDAQPGTLAQPFRTLDRARDAVRELKGKKPGVPVTVLVRGGNYSLERSVAFTGRDSGTAQAPVTYRAYPGEQPVFRGGKVITGWTLFRDKIYAAKLPGTENLYWRFRELFLNGERQIRARYPNFDPKEPDFGGWAFIESTVQTDTRPPVSFRVEPGVFTRKWAKPQQGEVFIIPGLAWLNHIIPIQAYDAEQGVITVTRRLNERWDNLMKGNRFYVENLLEELDQPGEWCFDTETQTLYFWPPNGTLDGAEVTAPVTDRLIELRATTSEQVRYLRFEGLTFTQTLPAFPFTNSLQPDYVDCNRSNSAGYAFYLENTEHCTISGCRFDQVGGDAIRMSGVCSYNRIVGNEIVKAGGQGISAVNLDFWPYEFPAIWRDNQATMRSVSSRLPWAVGNVISGNHIHHCGVIDNFGAAIHFHGYNTDKNIVSHNHIHDQPHHAIYFSMGFGQNIVEYNDISALCRVMADAGGVYFNRWTIVEGDPVLQQGSIIRYNRVRDVLGVRPQADPSDQPATTPSQDRIHRPHFTWGIYFDNSPRRTHIYGNLCIVNVEGGVFLGGGYAEPEDCLVENNIFVDSSGSQFDVAMAPAARGNRFVRNIAYYHNPEAAMLRTTRDYRYHKKQTNDGLKECDYNLYYLVGGGPLKLVGVESQTFEQWRAKGYDQHSVVSDPLFVDPAAGDYRLKPESPALALGFKPIPYERIGLAGFKAAESDAR